MSVAVFKKIMARGDTEGEQSMDRRLTPRRQSGKLKSNQQRDMCLALVSHELRTPTNAIVGWARLIKGGGADERTLAHGIDVIERNATLQAKLIEQLLDFSRVSAFIGVGESSTGPASSREKWILRPLEAASPSYQTKRTSTYQEVVKVSLRLVRHKKSVPRHLSPIFGLWAETLMSP
jgi:signal transduction histidine kinase